jgi:hypothetical protein
MGNQVNQAQVVAVVEVAVQADQTHQELQKTKAGLVDTADPVSLLFAINC